METIFEDSKKRKISEKAEIQIGIKSTGLYLLKISTRARGEKQLGSSDDEDLRIEINGRKFPQLGNSTRNFDSPASFSGGRLHGLRKTVFFLLELSSGKQTISLVPDRSATFESLSVYQISSGKTIGLDIDEQAEDGDRRDWITFVLVDLALASFSVETTLRRRFIDSDDVKVIVDGVVQRSYRSVLHKFWYFIGSLFLGEKQSATFGVNLASGLHYVEFWADRMPILNSIKFALSEDGPAIQKYNDSKFGRDYNRFDGAIIDSVTFWNSFFQQQDYSQPILLDPSLVKAIVYRESRLGYFPDENIVDVMQVWDPENPAREAILGEGIANEFISAEKIGHMSYSYPKDRVPPKVQTPAESIFWGVRWLYYKAQYILENDEGQIVTPYVRKWRNWKEAVRAYNGNVKLVEEYVKEVFLVYEDGVDLEGNVLWERKK